MTDSLSECRRRGRQRVGVKIEELSMEVQFPCELLFSLKAKDSSASDKDKYFFEGGTIFPNSTLEVTAEPEDPLELLIMISSKSLIAEVGFISLGRNS